MKINKFLAIILTFLVSTMQFGLTCLADFENTEGEFVYYEVSEETFREFVESPSLSVLANSQKITYSKNELHKKAYETENDATTQLSEFYREKEIKYVREYEGKKKTGTIPSGYLHIHFGTFPIELDFVEYVSSKKNIKELLSENGIDCNINHYIGLSQFSPFVPVIIWISTDSGNYFITVEVSQWNPKKEYSYTVYSQAEFYDIFSQKDGICTVDNVDIPVKYEYTRVYLPFRKVLEAMGSTVTWDQEHQAAFFTTPNGSYAASLLDDPVLIEATDTQTINSGYTFYGVMPYYVKNINGTIMIDGEFMKWIAEVYGADLNIDMKNLAVTISTTN